MVQVKVTDDDEVDERGQVGTEEGKVGEAPVVAVAHVHTAIKHDALAMQAHKYA